jgi:predicted O-linked N-acetylglucosamine transferase (SPINDLY family)
MSRSKKRQASHQPRPQSAANLAEKFNRALSLYQHGQSAKAEPLCRDILREAPDQSDVLHLLGVIEAQSQHYEAARQLIGRALRIDPDNASAHANLGNVLRDLKRHEEALTSYDRALALQPDNAELLNNRGVALCELDRHEDALASYERALWASPRYVVALYNRGKTLRKLKRYQDAIATYDFALAIKPDYAEALYSRGNALLDLKRHEDALASYDGALALVPNDAEALYNRGNALQNLRRFVDAIASYDRALAVMPDHTEALYNRGTAWTRIERYEQAATDFERLLRVRPDYPYLRGDLLHSRMHCCDWNTFEAEAALIEAEVRAGKRSCTPFAFLAISRSPHDTSICSRIHASDKYPASPSPLWQGEKHANGKIRVGYVSGEFREQATSYLIAGLFELHDRDRFELYAFDNCFDAASPIRRQIEATFDGFVDISRKSDLEAAQIVHKQQIDVLVNLNGYFGLERTGVFAHRPCPVQVSFLGFPATLGADYIDYILADRCVIREDEHRHYSEKVVYLPDSYQVNSKRGIATRAPSREEVGLPESGFVFCCFNNTYKMTPDLFDVWMRLLRGIDGSVLWLLEANAAVQRNLGREAERRGIAADRLVFSPRVRLEDHIARHRLADLFLDTLPYNAHTTASDALWAGLPVVTALGSTFPGRVAASALNAIGLPELVTHTLEKYEALALKLATDPGMLADIKAKLAQNRLTHPLFDTDRFRQHIESAYITMWERYQRGEAPASFAVQQVR